MLAGVSWTMSSIFLAYVVTLNCLIAPHPPQLDDVMKVKQPAVILIMEPYWKLPDVFYKKLDQRDQKHLVKDKLPQNHQCYRIAAQKKR